MVYLCLISSFYNYWFMFMLLLFLFKTSAHVLVNFIVYLVYCALWLSQCLCSILFVLLDIAKMSWVLHTYALSRIVPRCIYFVYFALVVWLDMQVIISDCFVVHVRMNVYLLYVHWSHFIMTALVWSSVWLHDIYCLHTWSHYACSCSYLVFNLS